MHTRPAMSITLFTLLVLCAVPILGLLVPQHNCDGHFHYALESENQTYIGIFTAPPIFAQNLNSFLKWEATFEMQGKRDIFVSKMKTYPINTEAATNFIEGKPAEVFVEFLNITTSLPKLRSFYLNDQLLCSTAEYGLPKTRYTVTHKINLSAKTSRTSPEY